MSWNETHSTKEESTMKALSTELSKKLTISLVLFTIVLLFVIMIIGQALFGETAGEVIGGLVFGCIAFILVNNTHVSIDETIDVVELRVGKFKVSI